MNNKKYYGCGKEIKVCRTLYYFGKNEACVECAIMGFYSPKLRIVFRSWWKTATSRNGVNYGE